MTPRIALISYSGYDAVSNPLLYTAEFLASEGWTVDVYGRLTNFMPAPTFRTPAIAYHGMELRQKSPHRFGLLCMAHWVLQAVHVHGLRAVIGYDPDGLILAAIIASRLGVPYMYHSLELYIPPPRKRLKLWLKKRAEIWLARRAAWVITQDPLRAEWMIQHLGLRAERMVIVPNCPPMPATPGRGDWLRRTLGLAPDQVIVLNVGSMIPHHMAGRLAESAATWPEGFVLVLHGWFPDPKEKARCERAAQAHPDRIKISTQTLPPDQKDEIYRSADIGLVFYEPWDDNLRRVAGASGKLFDFMRHGVPVVVRRLPGMDRLVKEPGWGVLVESPDELGAALKYVWTHRAELSRASLRAYETLGGSGAYAQLRTATNLLRDSGPNMGIAAGGSNAYSRSVFCKRH
jgi:glycosyltransferase involved in cell wall biosynthesis